MVDIGKVQRGLISYAEQEIAPAFAGSTVKEVLVGAAMEYYIRGKLPALGESMGVIVDGQVDVDMLIDILGRQMDKHPDGITMELRLNPLQRNEVDVIRLRRRDIDTMRDYIMRA